MKTIYFLPLLLVALIFSCQKAEEPDLTVNPFFPNGGTTGGGNTSAGTFTYKVDGIPVTVTSLQALEVFDTTSTPPYSSIISITGLDATHYLYLWLDKNTTVGKHEIGKFFSDYNMDYLTVNDLFKSYSAEERLPVVSEYNITKHDKANKRIEGTFYGVCVYDGFNTSDSVKITDGSFAVTYTDYYQ